MRGVPTLVRVALAGLLASAAAGQRPAAGQETREILDAWLARQAGIEAWSARIVQKRSLPSLARPLEADGRVWFAQPGRFRWQLGEPPRTLAVRAGDALTVVYPRLRQIERYAGGAEVDAAWSQVLTLLEVGFPSDAGLFRERYEELSAHRAADLWSFELRPASPAARRLVTTIRLELSADGALLQATELEFPDGSRMRTEFSEHDLEPELDPALFEIEVPPGYEVVTPLAGGR